MEQTVKMLTIALTRIVLTKAHVLSNTIRTNVHVIRDTQVVTASILTVMIMDAKIMQRVSMDTPITRVHVFQDIWVIYVKQRIFVTIRNAQGAEHVKIQDLAIHVHVMQNI